MTQCTHKTILASTLLTGAAILAIPVGAQLSEEAGPLTAQWWSPGDGRAMPDYVQYANDFGFLGVVNDAGTVDSAGHPFFEPLGSNGRACVSCHQPAYGMSLSVPAIVDRWDVTGGTDPIFAAIDGMNCPNLAPGDPDSHSLLLKRGLFRIPLPWPPIDANGEAIEPEF